jgi:hypothetical protein
MLERDICRELGCPGLCCRNSKFDERRDSFLSCFTNTQRINIEEVPLLVHYPDGVYYLDSAKRDFPDWIIGYIKGNCPHLAPRGGCLNYGQRTSACRNYLVGGTKCNKLRNRAGLQPVPKELVSPQDRESFKV